MQITRQADYALDHAFYPHPTQAATSHRSGAAFRPLPGHIISTIHRLIHTSPRTRGFGVVPRISPS
jgi:hypothetical protein